MENSSQYGDRKQRYKQLLDESNQLQQDIGHQMLSETCRAVQNIVHLSDNMHKETGVTEKVENTSEIVMDAQLMKSIHESVSKIMLTTSEFTDGMYCNGINALISQSESDNWRVITEIALSVARPAFTKSSMLGAIDVEPKVRVVKEKQQRRRTVLTQEKRPETIKQLKRDDRGAEKVNIILKQVSDLFRQNNRQPIPYFRLIIDPHNFMNTVENAFQMAFLARDGNVAIEGGEDGYPQVRLVPKDEIAKHTDTTQAICSLNMKLCKQMIDFYEISEAMLDVPVDVEDSTRNINDDEEDD
ncbi:non-structural maintenance of chromosomes element 4 homolog A [Calliphora vicina]|uniref:non-structural maintenance of chromosomes element 4 homolog A n=1 Tax=Calliphora vicina TaxID=7373 RepID=UPI00325A6EE6